MGREVKNHGSLALSIFMLLAGCSSGAKDPNNSEAALAGTENLCIAEDTRSQLRSILIPTLDRLQSAYGDYIGSDRIKEAFDVASVDFAQSTGDGASCKTTAIVKIDGQERYRTAFEYTVKKSLDGPGYIVEAFVGGAPNTIAPLVTSRLDEQVYLEKDRRAALEKFGPEGPEIPEIFFGKWCQVRTENTLEIGKHRIDFVDVKTKPMRIIDWYPHERDLTVELDMVQFDKSRAIRMKLSTDGENLTLSDTGHNDELTRCE